ncbi:MurR/RpiR family transcriptional regulator [Planococcus shenhongbingii]|uniref:MurR/RpiR family transcriptional regulator n=1 Tax=Planococcus shenhongbingii TaxID=3058398 RepID=UPI00260AAB8A|nr:MurR/RpiR family transcriptional regulator [Planococcus sp. N016]WKA58272.1 MurR/RpiR family transcriptional regulator [Planococcus sp. N016]
MIPTYELKTKNKFPELTKGLKKVADALLNDSSIFARHSAKQIGEIIGVSETMVIRFCVSIGYQGFSELQKDVRNYLLLQTKEDSNEQNIEISQLNNFAKHIKADIDLLKNNIRTLDTEKFEDIVETIIKSERIVIAGYYQSFTFAHWLFFNLNYTLGNASLYRPETDALVFDFLPDNSCVIVFSFSRYALDTIRFAEDAKKKGVKVIAFTDSRLAPIVDHADIVALVEDSNQSLFDKGPVTMSLINSILREVMKRAEKKVTNSDKFKYFLKEKT